MAVILNVNMTIEQAKCKVVEISSEITEIKISLKSIVSEKLK